jgi:DNA-binding transcriptional ArsR family regulator
VISIEVDMQPHADGRWTALADPTRRRIVEMLGERPRTASEIHASFAIANPAVSRHLRVLREAGLISERRIPDDKRVRLYELEAEPLRELSNWLEAVRAMWSDRLESFRQYVALRGSRPTDAS